MGGAVHHTERRGWRGGGGVSYGRYRDYGSRLALPRRALPLPVEPWRRSAVRGARRAGQLPGDGGAGGKSRVGRAGPRGWRPPPPHTHTTGDPQGGGAEAPLI